MADDDKRAHLGFLQDAISRMASNSFVAKGWSVTVAVALLGFATNDSAPRLALLALVPIFVFWGLDGYYLSLERGFRVLYTTAVSKLTAVPLTRPKKV